MNLLGVDFTSAPNRRKAITVALGDAQHGVLTLRALKRLTDWQQFQTLLETPGPWLGGFDFPFGLPRELINDLGWPATWSAMIGHCQTLGRRQFCAALNAYRESRPYGQRYAHRASDGPAGSSSPMKLVNPPVGLMFFEGAPRLLTAGVDLPGLHAGDRTRVALDAYPAYLARKIVKGSYKNDAPAKQTLERSRLRVEIVDALCAAQVLGVRLSLPLRGSRAMLIEDASGDLLDAVLCLMQAAWAAERCAHGYGLPAVIDPVEGWIVGVPPALPA